MTNNTKLQINSVNNLFTIDLAGTLAIKAISWQKYITDDVSFSI